MTLNNSFRNISPSSFSCISFKWLKKSRVQVKASDVLCKWKTSYKGYRDISTNSQIYIIQLPAQLKFTSFIDTHQVIVSDCLHF
jgi:hypothetical protein